LDGARESDAQPIVRGAGQGTNAAPGPPGTCRRAAAGRDVPDGEAGEVSLARSAMSFLNLHEFPTTGPPQAARRERTGRRTPARSFGIRRTTALPAGAAGPGSPVALPLATWPVRCGG